MAGQRSQPPPFCSPALSRVRSLGRCTPPFTISQSTVADFRASTVSARWPFAGGDRAYPIIPVHLRPNAPLPIRACPLRSPIAYSPTSSFDVSFVWSPLQPCTAAVASQATTWSVCAFHVLQRPSPPCPLPLAVLRRGSPPFAVLRRPAPSFRTIRTGDERKNRN